MPQKGVTLIQLVVLIIVLLIIVSFAIFSVDNITDESIIAREHESLKEVKIGVDQTLNLEAEATMLKTEMNNVKKALILVYQKYETQMIDEIEGQEGVLYNEPLKDNSGTIVEDWYVIYGMDSNKYSEEVIENLSLDELKKTYEVNFETKDVRLKDSVTIGEYSIKTYEDIETVLESGAL